MTTPAVKNDYIMDSDLEGERIELKTNTEETLRQLDLCEIRSNNAVLDVGCASGATTRLIAKRTYPGKSTGIDISETRIAYAQQLVKRHKISNVEFKVASAYQTGFADETFDVVWSRFLFEYLESPQSALQELIRVCKKNGKVIVGDLDMNCLIHYPFPAHLEKKWNEIIEFAKKKTGFDPHIGRKLYHMFHTAGLRNIKLHMSFHHQILGSMTEIDLFNWKQKLAAVEPHWQTFFKRIEEYHSFCDAMISMWQRKDRLTYSILCLAEGIK